MSVINFEQLKEHVGHKLEIAVYGNPQVNATIECLRCNEVLLSFDKED